MKMPFTQKNGNGNGSTPVVLSEEDSRLLSSLAQAIQLAQTNFQLAYEQVCRRLQKEPTIHDLVPTPGQAGRVSIVTKESLVQAAMTQMQAQQPQQPQEVYNAKS